MTGGKRDLLFYALAMGVYITYSGEELKISHKKVIRKTTPIRPYLFFYMYVTKTCCTVHCGYSVCLRMVQEKQ